MSGTAINCPSCGSHLVIPEPDVTNIRTHNPIATSAAAREEHHFSVPVHDTPSEVLVQKPQVPIDVVASHGKNICVSASSDTPIALKWAMTVTRRLFRTF